MVSTGSDAGGTDRAQLLLVGSVGVAIIVVGLVVVVNTVLFTENVPTSEALDETAEIEKFDYEVRRNVQSIILQLNHRERNRTKRNLSTNISGSVTSFTRLLGETYIDISPRGVNVTYNNDSSAFGGRIVQQEDGDFTRPSSSSGNWTVLDSTERRDVGRFLINVNISETDQSPFYLEVSNGTETYNLTLLANSTGPTANLTVVANRTIGGNVTVNCDSSAGRVLIDTVEGRWFNEPGCGFNGLGEIDPPYDIQFKNGNRLHGQYGFAVNESVLSATPADKCNPSSGTGPPLSEPCHGPVVWTANITATYDASTAVADQTYNVSVYP